uniref:Uncharacterized protein n=1 Tax=viral metagenome TaxID=1070528 RepID=A0A6C0HY88_9ZZZZ
MFPGWKQKRCAEILHENEVIKYLPDLHFVMEDKKCCKFKTCKCTFFS